jgi:hypothetical protein
MLDEMNDFDVKEQRKFQQELAFKETIGKR